MNQRSGGDIKRGNRAGDDCRLRGGTLYPAVRGLDQDSARRGDRSAGGGRWLGEVRNDRSIPERLACNAEMPIYALLEVVVALASLRRDLRAHGRRYARVGRHRLRYVSVTRRLGPTAMPRGVEHSIDESTCIAR